MIRISVVGGGSAPPQVLKDAHRVGALLAQAGVTLLCGGLGGVMEAACRGAKEKGGLTVGILPGLDAKSANRFVDLPIVTGLGEARNVVVALSPQAMIAIGGALGTLTEMSFALKHAIPVVSLGSWTLSERTELATAIHTASSPDEAVELALGLARKS